MTLAPITVACQHCGSTTDVVYSCNPACCFNHVCGKCYTTFELATNKVGEIGELATVPPDPDPGGPTAPCARCGESKLFSIIENGAPSGRLACVSCKALLTLELTEIAPGSGESKSL